MTGGEVGKHTTELANERTYLAYIRTSLTSFVAGVSFIQFFNLKFVPQAGYVFVVLGIVVFSLGTARYLVMREKIKNG